MTDNLKKLTKPEKKVAAKTLLKEGYSPRTIEKWLGISDTSISRAANIATPDQLKRFEAEFKLRIKLVKKEALALVHKRMIELIPREKNLSALVRTGEFLEGKPYTPTAADLEEKVRELEKQNFQLVVEKDRYKYGFANTEVKTDE